MNGVAFQLSDFTGGTTTLAGVDGIEIDDSGITTMTSHAWTSRSSASPP